jgi:urease accessory protein
MTSDPALLALLQFSDGVFPAGGFAHSLGLESYVHQGRVRDRDGLERFVGATLEGAVGPSDAVAVALATRLAHGADVEGWIALDERLEAMKTVPEFRAASAQMGRQTLRVAAAVGDDEYLIALARAAAEGLTPAHHAAVFGAAVGRAGADAERAAAAFLYSTASALVGAGLRLLALGQLDGQRVLTAMRDRVSRLAALAAVTTADDMWSFAPSLEIAGVQHATLDGRLFRS